MPSCRASDLQAAAIHIDCCEVAVAIAMQQQAVARVVAAVERSHTVQIPRHQQIGMPVAVKIAHECRVDRRELRFERQGPQFEMSVTTIQRHRAGERV